MGVGKIPLSPNEADFNREFHTHTHITKKKIDYRADRTRTEHSLWDSSIFLTSGTLQNKNKIQAQN